MTMTAKRLAELDAVMAKMSEPRPTKIEHKYTISDWCGRIEYAKYALADAYPDMRAHIDTQAATIARSRAEVERLNGRALVLEAHLTEAIERVEKGDLDDRMCCDGHMCGCQGSTNADQFLHFARAALTGAASE